MQISRHWRMNSNRYRLEGVKNEDGSVSMQNRLQQDSFTKEQETTENRTERTALSAA